MVVNEYLGLATSRGQELELQLLMMSEGMH